MITVCTVIVEPIKSLLDQFLKSIYDNTTEVSNVIVVNADAKTFCQDQIRVGKMCITQIDLPVKTYFGKPLHDLNTGAGIQHAIALNYAINSVTDEYVLLSDPDIFFMTKIDDFYLNLIKEHKLDIVGCSHQDALSHAYRFFPNHVNCMVKRTSLPDKNFLINELKIRNSYTSDKDDVIIENETVNAYLLPGKIPGYSHLFPNLDGYYETGCNLWIWATKQKWRWLSFQTADRHVYNTRYFKGSEKFPRMPFIDILYHATHSASFAEERTNFVNKFKEYYASSHGA